MLIINLTITKQVLQFVQTMLVGTDVCVGDCMK